jgi:hypothetical protein
MEQVQRWAMLAALSEHGTCSVRVHGRSMWPCLRDGDRVRIIRRCERLHPGDVVAVFEGEQLVVHRIALPRRIKAGSTHLIIYGDSSPCSAHCLSRDRIEGIVRPGETFGVIRSLFFYPPLSVLAAAVTPLLRVLALMRSR